MRSEVSAAVALAMTSFVGEHRRPVCVANFEDLTLGLFGPHLGPSKVSIKGKGSQLLLKPFAVTNAPCVIRTHDRLLRRQLLYPAELREHPVILAVRAGRHGWISAIGF